MKRRTFLAASTAAVCGAVSESLIVADEKVPGEKLIDIHQHTHYHGRSDDGLRQHQRALGASKTVLLPAGSQYGLEANCYGNDSALALVKQFPKEFVFFANELPDLPETRQVLEKYLKLGAKGIGEVSMTGMAAAIANAVFHATGKRLRELPITLDKVMA
mgnify:CR=1 FL=1